jgi:hypothetical protein
VKIKPKRMKMIVLAMLVQSFASGARPRAKASPILDDANKFMFILMNLLFDTIIKYLFNICS